MPEVVVALTGASGEVLVRLIEALVEHNWSVRLIVTGTGAINLDLECSMTPSELASMNGVILEDNGNLAAKSASGSARFDAYVVACKWHHNRQNRSGISDNLATRALVAMKERRKLIIVPREAPYSTPHLKAMFNLSNGGCDLAC